MSSGAQERILSALKRARSLRRRKSLTLQDLSRFTGMGVEEIREVVWGLVLEGRVQHRRLPSGAEAFFLPRPPGEREVVRWVEKELRSLAPLRELLGPESREIRKTRAWLLGVVEKLSKTYQLSPTRAQELLRRVEEFFGLPP
jgi:hypothetical protein